MAKKTLLRQIISKWGIMSTELVMAQENDHKFMQSSGKDIVSEELEEPVFEQNFSTPAAIAEAEPVAEESMEAIDAENINLDDL